jgi:hypothetical protein
MRTEVEVCMNSKVSSPAGTAQTNAGVAAETLRQIGDATGISVWTWHAETDRVYHAANAGRGALLDQGVALSDTLAHLHPGDSIQAIARG